jgi:predicted ABC-type sugar transport system permease subunit
MTRLGVHIYALGGNRAAARLSGVDVAKTTLLVYGISGLCDRDGRAHRDFAPDGGLSHHRDRQ